MIKRLLFDTIVHVPVLLFFYDTRSCKHVKEISFICKRDMCTSFIGKILI